MRRRTLLKGCVVQNQYNNFSKKEVNFQGGYYGKVEAEHFKMQKVVIYV